MNDYVRNWQKNTLLVLIAQCFMWLSVSVHSAQTSQVNQVNQQDPYKMVDELSQLLIAQLNDKRALLEKDPKEVKKFASQYVLPYVDTPKMARYVLGRTWRTASSAQKEAFVDAFTNTLIRSYSQSLLNLNIVKVTVQPARMDKPERATIESKVEQADGNKTDVIYRAFLDQSSNKWMFYDVAVEGISMLLNYRKAYASDISRKGLDAVINEMQQKNSEFNA